MIFDVLSIDGMSLMQAPYSERRTHLEALNLSSPYWQAPAVFDDGVALFEAVCAHELEGVVAKRRSSTCQPGQRGWVKTKNRDYWRYELERESAISVRRQRLFI